MKAFSENNTRYLSVGFFLKPIKGQISSIPHSSFLIPAPSYYPIPSHIIII